MKYFKLFESFVDEALNEGALTGKQEKLLKKQGWSLGKPDGNTISDILSIFQRYMEKKGGIERNKEQNSSGYKVMTDDNPGSWDMWSINHPNLGPIRLVSYKEDPFNDRKYATCLLNFNGNWWFYSQSYKDVVKDAVDMLLNPNFSDKSASEFESAFLYYRMNKA
jgi:hypothetical protein